MFRDHGPGHDHGTSLPCHAHRRRREPLPPRPSRANISQQDHECGNRCSGSGAGSRTHVAGPQPAQAGPRLSDTARAGTCRSAHDQNKLSTIGSRSGSLPASSRRVLSLRSSRESPASTARTGRDVSSGGPTPPSPYSEYRSPSSSPSNCAIAAANNLTRSPVDKEARINNEAPACMRCRGLARA